jgi:anti-sigma factor RsiW
MAPGSVGADVMTRSIELVVITPMEVSAFVDGELTPEERLDVAACARDDDRAACLVTAWQGQLALLHAAFGPIVEEPVPDRLRRAARVESRPIAGRRSSSPRAPRAGEEPHDEPDHRQ